MPRRDTLERLIRVLFLEGEQRLAFDRTGRPRPRRPQLPSCASSHASRPTNLPRQLTSFVGREQELAELQQLVVRVPLVTLTGTGGVGKSRLALQLAAQLISDYPQGVWLVELAPLVDPGLVPQAVAMAVGVPEQADRGLHDTLLSALERRRLLQVLDNCEHLAQASAALVEKLLRSCPQVHIVVTSREPMHLRAERVFPSRRC